MMNFEEAGYVLDLLMEQLPEGIFRSLNGGVSLIEDERMSDDGRYTLGTYFVNGMGRYIEIYYGSFSCSTYLDGKFTSFKNWNTSWC